jgi:hypothetical protein
MTQDLVWLYASLFCSKNHWNALLAKGINPFISCLLRKNKLTSFHVQLSYASGENIRLSLLTEAAEAEELAKRMDRYFKDFFSDAGFPKKEPQLPVVGVFLPFPANTIQYGLYSLSPNENANAVDKNDFRKEFSILIIEALGEKIIDEETILTFAFYLHVAWLKTMAAFSDNQEELVQLYDQGASALKAGAMDPQFLINKYADNQDILHEITQDILRHGSDVACGSPAWLGRWMQFCEGVTEKAWCLPAGQKVKFKAAHSQVARLINEQLGLTENMSRLLFYFISQASLNSDRIKIQ